MSFNAISLFSGAGGMDVGFRKAGFNVLWANDIDKDACETYSANHTNPIECGDLNDHFGKLSQFQDIDVVFGGPPCQGFSVAGKMDPNDPRSALLWKFLDVVEVCKPKVFVCENVKALGTLQKWEKVRARFLKIAQSIGYQCRFIVLNAKDYGVPQGRERVFFLGSRSSSLGDLEDLFEQQQKRSPTVRETIVHLGRAGSETNSRVCKAKITLAANPVMRRSPYAGMLFNGLGRPVKLDHQSSTLPASMGGNKTPIIDEGELYEGLPSWVEDYHRKLIDNIIDPKFAETPKRLRRLTIDEALLIQTFPHDYIFKGKNASIFKQIGNAVPCELAHSVAMVAQTILEDAKPTSGVTRRTQQIMLPV